VSLVDDDCGIGAKLWVAGEFGEEDAVGHDLDGGAWCGLVLESDLDADQAGVWAAELFGTFFGDACGDSASGEPARLGVADDAGMTAGRRRGGTVRQFEENLRELGGFARAGFAADDDDLMSAHGVLDFGATFENWKGAGR